MRRAIDRLPDVDHGAADRDHDVPRQPPSAVSDTWYANNLSDGWLSVTVERWPPLSSATADAPPTRRTSPRSGSGCASSASPKTGSTSTTDSPAPTGRGPATFAEFEVDLLRMRTREGMAVARAKGRLKGRRPKLSTKQQTELRRMHGTGDYTITDLVSCARDPLNI
jgi:hypothetical protein